MRDVADIQFQRAKVAPRSHPLIKYIWRSINEQQTSQELVAERAGVSSSTMRKWRRADRSPSLLQIEAVLNVLGYDLCIRRSAEAGHVMGRVVEASPQQAGASQ